MLEAMDGFSLISGMVMGGGTALLGFYVGGSVLLNPAKPFNLPSLPKFKKREMLPPKPKPARECVINFDEDTAIASEVVKEDPHAERVETLKVHRISELAPDLVVPAAPAPLPATPNYKPPRCATCNLLAAHNPAGDGKHYCKRCNPDNKVTV